MKLILLLLLLPLIGQGQSDTTNPYKYFKLDESRKVIFQAVYTRDTTVDILSSLNKLHGITNVKDNGLSISFDLSSFKFDHKKYDIPLMKTITIYIHNITANGIIELKENKYRVTLTNLVSRMDDYETQKNKGSAMDEFEFSEFLTKNHGKEWKLGGFMMSADNPYSLKNQTLCVENQLYNMFYFTNKPSNNW